MKGDIAKIQEKKIKSGKKLWLLSIDGKNYGIWDKSLVDDLEQGDTTEFLLDSKQRPQGYNQPEKGVQQR